MSKQPNNIPPGMVKPPAPAALPPKRGSMISINPGSGPVSGTIEQARANIAAMVEDIGLPSIRVEELGTDDAGRFRFRLTEGKIAVTVDMPGLPLERVRYVDSAGQNIWHFPRLYVDGSSWVWKYALSILRRDFVGEEE